MCPNWCSYNGPEGHGRYLVEFRIKEGWDAGIPRPAVFVHMYEGTLGGYMDGHSDILSDANCRQDGVAGDVFNIENSKVEVLGIDAGNRTCTVRLSFTPYAHTFHVNKYYAGGVTDGSYDHPFRRVLDGYNAAHDGDAIVIRGADYSEGLPALSKKVLMDSDLDAIRLH